MQVWCDWQLTLCDPHLSALEVRFHDDALYKSMFTLPLPAESVGVGRMFEFVCLSVCLFVRSIGEKRKIPKRSKFVQRIVLEYPRNDMILGFQGHRLRL